MKQVKCKSGIMGWQSRLQEQYEYFELFESYDSVYGNAKRLGYNNANDAWNANPIIQGSTNPSDYMVVLDEHNRCEFIREEIEQAFKEFLESKRTKEQLITKLNSFDNKLKKLFGTKGNKSIWFRTFKGNTLATDIANINTYFNLPASHNNYKHFIECLEIGVNEVGMEVYFS